MAFVPNEKGLERLLSFPIPWASVFVAASETFNQKNVNASIAETLSQLKVMVDKCHEQKRKIRIYVSTVFGCPYEGEMSDAQLFSVLDKVIALNPDEIALSDTIGTATPSKTKSVISSFLKKYPSGKTAMHFHNTYGMAVASALEAANHGVKKFDGSTGGIGGCPYAKGATGNVPTESLWYAFFRSGLTSTLPTQNLQKVWEFLETELKVTVRSHLYEILKKGGKWYGVA
jgi:hydroxymethylglutaryl-CoA lyase